MKSALDDPPQKVAGEAGGGFRERPKATVRTLGLLREGLHRLRCYEHYGVLAARDDRANCHLDLAYLLEPSHLLPPSSQ